MAQPMQLPQQQQQTHHLQPHTQHLALQQQRAQQHQAGLVHTAAVGQQLRAPHLPAANVNKHMSAVRPGQQLQQPRPAGVHPSQLLQQQLQQQQQQRNQQLVAAQQAQQQQQQKAAAAAASKPAGEGAPAKRQKTADAFPPAPDDAQSLYEVLYKAEKAGAGILKSAAAASAAAAATAAGASVSVAAAAAAAATGSAADGPVTGVDEILRRAEAQAARAAAEPAGRGRAGAEKAADDDKLMPDSAIKRLLELQALNRVSVWVVHAGCRRLSSLPCRFCQGVRLLAAEAALITGGNHGCRSIVVHMLCEWCARLVFRVPGMFLCFLVQGRATCCKVC